MLTGQSWLFRACGPRNRYQICLAFPHSDDQSWICAGRRQYSKEQEVDKGEKSKSDEGRQSENTYPLSLPAKQLLTKYCSWAGVSQETWQVPKSHFPLYIERAEYPSHRLFSFLSKPIMEWASTLLTKQIIETDHDKEEFQRGALTAHRTVHEMLNDHNWEGLEGLLAPKVLQDLREQYEEFSSVGLTFSCDSSVEITPSGTRLSVWSSKSLEGAGIAEEIEGESQDFSTPEPGQAGATAAAIHPSMLGDTAGLFKAWESFLASMLPSLTGHYQIAHVDFHGTLTAKVMDDQGTVLLRVLTTTPRCWTFARGPLPKNLPRRELPLTWKLVSEAAA